MKIAILFILTFLSLHSYADDRCFEKSANVQELSWTEIRCPIQENSIHYAENIERDVRDIARKCYSAGTYVSDCNDCCSKTCRYIIGTPGGTCE